MASPILIETDALVPWYEAQESPLAPLSVQISATGTSCLIGEESDIQAAYLRALGGVDSSRSGELLLFGEAFNGASQQKWQQLRLKLGFVTRTAPLLSVLSGLENTVLPAIYHKLMSRPEAEATARVLLQEIGCQADLSLLPAFYSPLERTQLAIVRAAIIDPQVLLLEEPYHELDIDEYDSISPFLKSWAETHSLVVTTRNLHFVMQQADRIIFAGEDELLYFDGWEDFYHSSHEKVRRYLSNYRDCHSIDRDDRRR